MRFSKKTLAIGIGTLLTVSVPMSAYALAASCAGATATTPTARIVRISDTSSDGHSARADFYTRELAPATQYHVEALRGAGTSQESGTMAADVIQLRACTQNNNPLDTDLCSPWRS